MVYFYFHFSYPWFAPRGLEIEGMSIIKVPTPDWEQLFRSGQLLRSVWGEDLQRPWLSHFL